MEGMGQGRLKDIIHKIALDKNANATDKNKLTSIQNLLLVSSEPIPTDESIAQKKAMIEFAGLPSSVQNDRMQSLTANIDKIYPHLREVYPEFDLNFWKNTLTQSIKNITSTTPASTKTTPASTKTKQPTVKYTFNEQIYSVINNNKIEDSEKIKIIVKLTKPKIELKKMANQLLGKSKKILGKLFGKKSKKSKKGNNTPASNPPK
jgi:hypothetical protein